MTRLLALLAVAPLARADAQKPTFDANVLPILQQHCTGCHGNDKQRGGLNVATFGAVNAGGAGGAVLTPGDPDKSRLYTLSAHTEEPRMPPTGNRMPDAQLAVLKLWIEQGGRENAGSTVAAPLKPKVDIGLKAAARGKPDGPPPLPHPGKLPADPPARGRRAGAVVALAASPWAPLVAVGGPKAVLLYHADHGTLLGALPFPHGHVTSLKFSRNGKLLLAAGGRGGKLGRAVLYNVETGDTVTEVGSAESDAIQSADLSPDQSLIAVGGPSKLVRVYATADGSVVREIKKHTDWVTAVEFSPDGVLLATADRAGGLFVWEAGTGREFHALRGHTAMVSDLSWRADSNLLATASEDTTVRVWEVENGTQVKQWGGHGGGALGVRFTADGRLATVGRDRAPKLWDVQGKLLRTFPALPDVALRVAVSGDSGKLFAGDWGGRLTGWATADGTEVASLDANPPPAVERLKAAEAAVVAAEARVKQTADALAAAEVRGKQTADALAAVTQAAGKVQGELAAATRTQTESVARSNTLAEQAAAAKSEADRLQAQAVADANRLTAVEATAVAFAAAAKQLADASGKLPQNPDLAAAAKAAADLAGKHAAEVPAAQRRAADSTALAKPAGEKAQALAGQVAAMQSAAAAAAKIVAALQPRVKPVADAVGPAKAAADQATKAVAAARAAAEQAAATLTAAKLRRDQTRLVARK
jgi:hypothetical protein